jgi:hypothetical protein
LSFAKAGRRVFWPLLALPGLYVLFLYPENEPTLPHPLHQRVFVWNQDARWDELEAQFVALRPLGCQELEDRLNDGFGRTKELIDRVIGVPVDPTAPVFDDLEKTLFSLAPMVGACPDRSPEYLGMVAWMRSAVKDQSLRWDMNEPVVRKRMYRLLYGGRAAAEEVLLQMPPSAVPPLVAGDDEPSQTPDTTVLDVKIHSGDILVSRGGAPTSALIARGNDFPGNFSHVALAFVDPETKSPLIIESHIERGVTVSTLREYLEDVKLRVMILRLRADLPAMVKDPMLPHKAASQALTAARGRHIPYDFAMDIEDTTRMFCSEVVSHAYSTLGVTLWEGMSTISSPGVMAWLAAFGVRRFDTQEPSDLEYDPQLRVVAEWRSPETLFKDHVDNAVLESLLEGAERGDRMHHAWYLLPFARLAKLYSVVLNALGRIGPIPEGMSATTALRHQWLVKKHAAMNEKILKWAGEFRRREGYTPPYWELLRIARQMKSEVERE